MATFVKVTSVGFVGRDTEIRHTSQGTAVAKFSIAATERRKDKSGEYVDQTIWLTVEAWGRTAEWCSENVKKGMQVYVSGRLREDTYTDREGNERKTLVVNADDVQLLGKKEDREQSGKPKDEIEGAQQHARRQQAQRAGAGAGKPRPVPTQDDEDSDIPF